MRMPPLVAFALLAACATTPRAPDFHGDYTRENRVQMADGSAGFAVRDGLRIGRTHEGRAQVRIQLFVTNAHQCNLDGRADVTPAGLLYRERSADGGAPFALAIDVNGAVASLRIVEGDGHWLCGARGRWGGRFEKTGKRVAFVEE